MAGRQVTLAGLLRAQEPDLSRIIPVFISRFNAVYGNPAASRWDISKEEWQRYEFLGDRVLNLIIAQSLFVNRNTLLDEGRMTAILADVVSNHSLAELMKRTELYDLLIPPAIGEQGRYGEKITGGAFEAFIGSLYCEFGIDDVTFFVNTLLSEKLETVSPFPNSKGLLQEYFQKQRLPLPVYAEMGRSGPDDRPVFVIRLTLHDGRSFEGRGFSKSEAEKAAARQALEVIAPDI